VNFLMNAAPKQVYEKTKELILRVKDYRHFILAASDFFETYTPYENIRAFSDACQDFGGY